MAFGSLLKDKSNPSDATIPGAVGGGGGGAGGGD